MFPLEEKRRSLLTDRTYHPRLPYAPVGPFFPCFPVDPTSPRGPDIHGDLIGPSLPFLHPVQAFLLFLMDREPKNKICECLETCLKYTLSQLKTVRQGAYLDHETRTDNQ
ncbi:hypothetical protein DINM_003271 [Dirofilaria immitis]|nr:hypothetical protein [Dirofilaria immitis]